MTNNLVVTERARAGAGHHRPEQLNTLFVGRRDVSGRDAVVVCEDRVYTTVRRVDR